MRVLIIIPAFNEEQALAGLLSEIRALSPADVGAEIETVVIDDGSTDRTSDIAREGGARVLRLCRNLGIGGAVQSGLRLAHREHFDFAAQVDGDGQHPPHELARLVTAGKADPAPDLVVGLRFSVLFFFRSSVLCWLGCWWLRVLLRFVTRQRLTDPTSGFRLFGARALRKFDETYPYDFPEPESLAIARAAHFRITEVPVAMRERQGGRSSILGFSTIYYMLKVTIAVLLTYVRALGSKPEGSDANGD